MEPQAMTGVAFRHNLTETIARVAKGDMITVTNYGRPVAVVVPPEWYERASRALAAAGSGE